MSAATKPRRWRRPKVPARPGDPPNAWLPTRYGSVRLIVNDGDRIEVRGEILINNAQHDLRATFYRRDTRSPFHLGEDHDDPRPAAQRTHQVELSRPYNKPSASLSARGKATVEIDRAVSEWAATPQARMMLRAATKWAHADDAWSFGILIEDAQKRERQARKERLEAVRALGDVEAPRGPRFSPLSPATALTVYTTRLSAVIAELQTDPGGSLDLESVFGRLSALTALARPAGGRAEDPELWDALGALLELLHD
jgi:hypothetical protein